MEGPPVTLVVILLLFIFFSPDQPNVRFHSQREQERLALEKQQDFNVLANSTYGDLPKNGLNLTGFRQDDGFQWPLLTVAQEISRRQHIDSWYDYSLHTPVYHNIDGEVKGAFVQVESARDAKLKINLTELDPGTDYINYVFERNVTDSTGNLSIELGSLTKSSPYMPHEIKATIGISTDSSPGNGWSARVRGVHFPSGSVVLTTSSRKFNALPAIPHFTLTEEEFIRSTTTMNVSLTEIWKSAYSSNLDDAPILAAPKCELIVWLHQKPMAGNNIYISEIEEELSNPDGAPMGQPPPLVFNALIFSPDCGYILQADTVFGPKEEVYTALVGRLVAAFCLIMAGQIFLLKRQMERCATPSTRSRVSYHTFVIAAFGDGLIFFALVGLLVINLSVFLIAGIAAFLCCVHVAFLEVKFIFDIWTIQVGDPSTAERERARRAAIQSSASAATGDSNAPPATTEATPTNPPQDTVTGHSTPVLSTGGLPLPATAPNQASNPSAPTIRVTDTDLTTPTPTPRATFLSLYSRFYFALINLMFFTLWSASWPPSARHIYLNILAFTFFSLWLPQIYRNTMRNCRKALMWEYILGTSALRAIPVLYWYVDKGNILYADTNPRTAVFLGGWLAFQILVLAIQQFLGPRVFVKESWCPPAYDYHPILYDDLEAGGLPIGEITSASEGKDTERKGAEGARKVFDCAICMNEIDVPVISKEERKGGTVAGRSWLEQRNYMVTPCRHIFHSECLDGWMNMRLVCPVCREALPPL